MTRIRVAALCAGLSLVGGAAVPVAFAAGSGVEAREAWPGIAFEKPIQVAYPKDGTDRLFVLQRTGKIMVAKKYRGIAPVPTPKVFLDLTSLASADVIERGMGGLLSLAFHPDYKTNGRFFVFYGTAAPYQAVLASYKVSANPDVADPASGKVILSVPKVGFRHYGGGLAFGSDGYLYVGIGDQAAEFDSANVAQDVRSLEGKILRIDVNAPSGGKAYGIPTDNPWAAAGGGVRGEVWAYGIRNPWRLSFDREKGNLWYGDPGGKQREEIDLVPRGGNMGWPIMEGTKPGRAGAGDASRIVAPVYDYGRDVGSCCIGGVVYRGQRCPTLVGKYVFSDYMTAQVLALDLDASATKASGHALVAKCENVASIDEDAQGEIYLCGLDDDKVYTLAPAP